MRVRNRIVYRLVLPLWIATSSAVEGKRTAVRGLLDGDNEQRPPRVLKGSKEGTRVDDNEEEYDYYYPWDMHKYGPKERPPTTTKGKGLSTKSPAASPMASREQPTKFPYHSIKKKSSSKKSSKGKGKGQKGIKAKLSRPSSKLSKGAGKGGGGHGSGPPSPPSSPSHGKGGGGNGSGPPSPPSSPSPSPSPTHPINDEGTCALAESIATAIPEVVTRSPTACCDFEGLQAVYVTHALTVPEEQTSSGFETFWDKIYAEIVRDSQPAGVCFVMTGVDLSVSDRSTDEILLQATHFVSTIPNVVSMMVTDPTEGVDLITEVRSISDDIMAPSIGVFNAGYDNIIVESILSGRGRLPFIGYLEEASYGRAAAQISLDLLDGVVAQPLCFNARIGLVGFVGERCVAYYNEITTEQIEPAVGISCSASSTVQELYSILSAQNTNAVWAHGDCCTATAGAAEMIRQDGKTIVVGCMDEDTSGGRVDFVTSQPIALQGYSAASWANFPVIQAQQEGRDGRGEQFFPGLQSLVNTDIFNQVVL